MEQKNHIYWKVKERFLINSNVKTPISLKIVLKTKKDFEYFLDSKLKFFNGYSKNDCDWSNKNDARCLTSYIYQIEKHGQKAESQIISFCKNDPGTSSQHWKYFKRRQLKCCDPK